MLYVRCHYSYSDCRLRSDGTDGLVKLVQAMQHRRSLNGKSLFGAKITVGGSGGSVCVIGRNCVRSSEEILENSFQESNPDGLKYMKALRIFVLGQTDVFMLDSQIQQRYKDATGYLPFIFEGLGAGKFGFLRLRRQLVTYL